MKETILGNHLRKVPSIAVGCMRLSEKSKDEMNHFIHSALEQGAYFFDHADIYGGGMSETVFGEAFSGDPSETGGYFFSSPNAASARAAMICRKTTSWICRWYFKTSADGLPRSFAAPPAGCARRTRRCSCRL